jgi:enterochelin esterase-like enzyme
MRFASLICLFGPTLTLLSFSASSAAAQDTQGAPQHVFFRIQLASTVAAPVSGRVLVFIKRGSGDGEVDTQEFHPEDTWVTAKEVHELAPGASIEVDGADKSFPKSFTAMSAGDYEAQAVLDVDHAYNYSGRGPRDWMSPVVSLPRFAPGLSPVPTLTLASHPTESPNRAAMLAAILKHVKTGEIEKQELESPLLTRFWGRPTSIRAWIILPPGYADHPAEHFPTAYWTHGFGGNLESALASGYRLRERMEQGKIPPMIWVMLDESCAHGTHEFADSVNNGPWGAALTTEYIPMLERRYRMDARPTGRLLNGHSSGGWATLQLQINYPQVFGGTWSTSPDSSDFHDFTGPDLYAANANAYRRPDGAPYPIMRVGGKVVATLQQFAQLEDVLGPYGGQMSSFDWVFSPRSDSGAPEQLFDRKTGAVDPNVLAYWSQNYDLANIVERTWTERGALLKGRIHVIVGTADTFYLDGAAHKFEARLNRLGAEPQFTYLPGRSHFDLYVVDKDRSGLFDQIGAEMYAVARPGIHWKKEGK